MHHPAPPRSSSCRPVNPDLVDRLQAMVDRRTDAALTEQFGISYNTWRKLIAGGPVRASVLSRVQARIDGIGNEPPR